VGYEGVPIFHAATESRTQMGHSEHTWHMNIFPDTSSASKWSPTSMRKPCYTAPVWVFFVHRRHREITLSSWVFLTSKEVSLRTRAELGCTRHPYLFLSSSIQPAALVTEMGPWLWVTKQGMWPRQLPLVEHPICIGWLLFPPWNMTWAHSDSKSNIPQGLMWHSTSVVFKIIKWQRQSHTHGGWQQYSIPPADGPQMDLFINCANLSS